MIVITLTKVPASLRGDLTKWCQEIQTGVYVGNFSAKIRDLLWQRINKNIGSGSATMVYNINNELGYQFRTTRLDYDVVDFDGIPLMKHLTNVENNSYKSGFSKAARYHRARVAMSRKVTSKTNPQNQNIVVIDIETTGLNPDKNEIISIAAIKDNKSFYKLVKCQQNIPDMITQLTKIDNNLLDNKGIELKEAISDFIKFVGDANIVGYNSKFDISFLVRACQSCDLPIIKNKTIDLMDIVKKADQFLDSYTLATVLKKYSINNPNPHNSLSDANATKDLFLKLNKKYGILK